MRPSTIFLLSPARLTGRRGAMVLNPAAEFELAKSLRSAEGAPLGDVFSFVSGLYFRGKMTYARAFGWTTNGLPASHVLTAGGGLVLPDERVTPSRLAGWSRVRVHEDNPHFTIPLVRHASELMNAHDPDARFVLLGSVASNKYVEPLLDVFGPRLLFPGRFTGMGDMSRGSLLLRAVREDRELEYAPLADMVRERSPAAHRDDER